jgi:hypothetical protein
MKILLDENIYVRFKNYFSEIHEVLTIKDMLWNGIKNGELLLLLKKNNFDTWIVVDKNIPYQQNLIKLPWLLIVVNVYSNTLKHLLPLLSAILNILNNPREEKIQIVNE